MPSNCSKRRSRALLTALVIFGALVAGQPLETTAASGAETEFGDPDAKALALQVHSDAAAFDKLQRFSYRVRTGNADVTSMLDEKECSVPELMKSLDEAMSRDRWYECTETLAWSNKQALWSNSDRRFRNETQESNGDGSRQDRAWTIDSGFERGASSESPARFVFVQEAERLWRGRFTQLGYFRVTPHRFWWGISRDHNDTISNIPPELAGYRFLDQEEFDGEPCEVVESAARAERLWIGRESKRLRGVLVFRMRGAPAEPFHTTELVEKMAGRSFDSDEDYRAWVATRSESERTKLSIAWNETYFGQFGPNELIRFRDYHEVAPGVWIPFREDRAFTHRTKNKGHKYIHLWAAVQEVRTDVDLTSTVEKLQPQDGEQIQDQRFGFPINYKFRSSRTQWELHELVEQAIMRSGAQGYTAALSALDVLTTPDQLEANLRQKVRVIDCICPMTAAQKRKLELATRGDLRRITEQIAEIKSRLQAVGEDPEKQIAVRDEALAVRRDLLALSNHDTLLAGVLETLFAQEQASRYECLRNILAAGGRARIDDRGSGQVLAILLNDSTISDKDLQGLSVLPNVQYLNLSGTQVTDVGLKQLIGMTGLQGLDLTSTKVTDAGIAQLQAALPRLNIEK